MTIYTTRSDLQVAQELALFVEDSLLVGLPIKPDAFWAGFSQLLREFSPKNRALLQTRADLQAQIDAWLEARVGDDWDNDAWVLFLKEIGYIIPEGDDFTVETTAADAELATLAGAQLVVPVMNARFALNAANARWGSLYDALYGTDVLPGEVLSTGFDAQRGAQAVERAADFLDGVVPLVTGSHADVTGYEHIDGTLVISLGDTTTTLEDEAAFVGFSNNGADSSILLRNNGLHIELVFNRAHPVGAESASGLRDVVLESALTAIQDCEDSVAAVDAEDKVLAYSNWLGLMKGDLAETFEKKGQQMTRRLNADREFTSPTGEQFTLPGRAVLLVRNVGHLMTSDAILLDGEEIPEGIMDAMITVAAGMHDLAKTTGSRNSRASSIYVVKPKMHGAEEAAFANATYARVEEILGLAKGTVKLGLMDEERRTSANLRECIRALKERIVFINTGFLDRTGDEIHTVMRAGPVLPKGKIKEAQWLVAYEAGNVDAGLATGLNGKGQIGKGMWAKPDAMAEMLQVKIGHPLSGATTAWVPSPTAATLHATHYHAVNVFELHEALAKRERASLDTLMTPPLLGDAVLTDAQIEYEIDLNCQSILGYVVRWVDAGVGCSKVPDIDNIALMEDRATLRISAQFLSNWLLHGLITEAQVDDSLKRMAVAVDQQNAGDAAYKPMAPDYDGAAFKAARELIIEGVTQPSGYTEPLLHAWRRAVKAS